MKVNWTGVLPAITTPLDAQDRIDHDFMGEHARWMIDAGCRGVVALGSLGESATLAAAEKRELLQRLCAGLSGHAPVIAGLAGLATADAVALARDAAEAGCAGLMVLPPYAYATDWAEMKSHVRAVIRATALPCMLYNNPIAYRTDFLPWQVAALAEANPNLAAVKESSADIRRLAALRHLLGDRLELLVGVDDLIAEGIAAGARGWVAGLVNAFPAESVRLFDLALAGQHAEADALYRWFLPLLALDTVPKFVQLIKLAQACVGRGSETVRAPRLVLTGTERDEALRVIDHALAHRPALPVTAGR